MSFTLELARPADDAALRALLRETPMPGHLVLGYEREPNYFLGCDTMGPQWQIVVARHEGSGTVAGLACRATRPLFINGREETVGYLGQLRVAERFRGRWLVARGFRFLHELHGDGRARGYLSTIIAQNDEATGLLVQKPRGHYPTFRPVAPLLSLALLVRQGRAPQLPSGFTVERGSRALLPAIVAFLRQEGARKQFFPAYREADFLDAPLTRDFRVEDFWLLRRGGAIVGVAGLWDQGGYKQTVVRAYSGALRWARPALNVAIRAWGAPPLPAPGAALRMAYASFLCVADNDPALLRHLLPFVHHAAAQRGIALLMVGLIADDPLVKVVRAWPHIPYRSHLYTVCWPENHTFHDALDARLPYVELASL